MKPNGKVFPRAIGRQDRRAETLGAGQTGAVAK